MYELIGLNYCMQFLQNVSFMSPYVTATKTRRKTLFGSVYGRCFENYANVSNQTSQRKN